MLFLPTYRHPTCRNGDNAAMFKDVPYFCYSHLIAHVTVGTTTSVANPPVFNELLLPPNPMPLERVLSPADIAQAKLLVAQVRPQNRQVFCSHRAGMALPGRWILRRCGLTLRVGGHDCRLAALTARLRIHPPTGLSHFWPGSRIRMGNVPHNETLPT